MRFNDVDALTLDVYRTLPSSSELSSSVRQKSSPEGFLTGGTLEKFWMAISMSVCAEELNCADSDFSRLQLDQLFIHIIRTTKTPEFALDKSDLGESGCVDDI